MANELQTYGDASIVKSVQAEIEILTPRENLLMKNLAKSTAKQSVHQWQDDTLATAGSQANQEIVAFTPGALSTPTLRTNLIEHIYVAGSVSNMQTMVTHYSGKQEYARQVTKKMMDWSNAAEFDLLRSSLASGASGTAPQMNGVIKTLSTNVTSMTSGTVFSESILLGLLQLTWDNSNGDTTTDLLVGSSLKKTISGFTTNITKYIPVEEQKAGSVVQVYDSDFGPVNVHLHRYVQQSGDATNRIVGMRLDKFYIAYLQGGEVSMTEQAVRSTSRDFVIDGYVTLENRNEKSSFYADGFLKT